MERKIAFLAVSVVALAAAVCLGAAAKPETPPPVGKLLKTLGKEETDAGRGIVAMSLSGDGKKLLAAGSTGINLWDLEQGAVIKTFPGTTGKAACAEISPDGMKMLVNDGTKVKLLDLTDGKELRSFDHPTQVWSLRFSADGKRILAGTGDARGNADAQVVQHAVFLWDLEEEVEPKVFQGHKNLVRAVCFAGDGKSIFSSSNDFNIRKWDIASGKAVLEFPDKRSKDGEPKSHGGFVYSLQLSPDGTRLLSAAFDGSAKLWDVETGKKTAEFASRSRPAGEGDKKFRRGLRTAAFTPDGQGVLTGGLDQLVRLYDAATGAERMLFAGHSNDVGAIVVSPDGKTAISGGFDGLVKIWELPASPTTGTGTN